MEKFFGEKFVLIQLSIGFPLKCSTWNILYRQFNLSGNIAGSVAKNWQKNGHAKKNSRARFDYRKNFYRL